MQPCGKLAIGASAAARAKARNQSSSGGVIETRIGGNQHSCPILGTPPTAPTPRLCPIF